MKNKIRIFIFGLVVFSFPLSVRAEQGDYRHFAVLVAKTFGKTYNVITDFIALPNPSLTGTEENRGYLGSVWTFAESKPANRYVVGWPVQSNIIHTLGANYCNPTTRQYPLAQDGIESIKDYVYEFKATFNAGLQIDPILKINAIDAKYIDKVSITIEKPQFYTISVPTLNQRIKEAVDKDPVCKNYKSVMQAILVGKVTLKVHFVKSLSGKVEVIKALGGKISGNLGFELSDTISDADGKPVVTLVGDNRIFGMITYNRP